MSGGLPRTPHEIFGDYAAQLTTQEPQVGAGRWYLGLDGAYSFTLPQRSEEDIRQEKEALDRAYALLEETIGKQEAAKVDAGGAYLIRSKIWKKVRYGVVKRGLVLILEQGLLRRNRTIGASCIETMDSRLPWPDMVLAKIKAIQADETIVFATGNVQP